VTSRNDEKQNDDKRQISLDIKKAGLNSYQSALLIWRYVFVSLPLDILIALYALSSLLMPGFTGEYTENLSRIILLLALIGILAIGKERLIDTMGSLRRARMKTAGVLQRYSLPVIILLALVILAESLFRIDTLNLVSIVVSIAIAIGAAISVYHTFQESSASNTELANDRLLFMERINKQILLLHVIPIFSTRAISLIAALIYLPTEGQGHMFILAFLASAALLLALMPQQEQFISTCKTCTFWIPRALREFDNCPLCASSEFQKPEEAQPEFTPEQSLKERLQAMKDHLQQSLSSKTKKKGEKGPTEEQEIKTRPTENKSETITFRQRTQFPETDPVNSASGKNTG